MGFKDVFFAILSDFGLLTHFEAFLLKERVGGVLQKLYIPSLAENFKVTSRPRSMPLLSGSKPQLPTTYPRDGLSDY